MLQTLFLNVRYHVDAPLVAAALKACGKEGVEYLCCKPFSYDTPSQAQNVCIVVEPCVLCHVAVRTQRRPDALYLVGAHGYAYAGAAYEHRPVRLAGDHQFAGVTGNGGVVYALPVGAARFDLLFAHFVQMRHESLFKLPARMIAAYCYHICSFCLAALSFSFSVSVL